MPVPPGVAGTRGPEDLAPLPEELTLFARLEGLVGEEAALLKARADERSEEQKARLHEIGTELDRIWDKLRERADRLGHREPADNPAA
jgi:hypothetical protein